MHRRKLGSEVYTGELIAHPDQLGHISYLPYSIACYAQIKDWGNWNVRSQKCGIK
jgi:hypothetical protein